MIILASQSPTRRTLLSAAGFAFKSVTPPLDEESYKTALPDVGPKQLALTLAKAKALAAASLHPQAFVIGADQTLEFEGQCLHKTASLQEARVQLQRLAGKTHRLHSAVAVYRGQTCLFEHVATAELTMRTFGEGFLDHYLETVDPGVAKSLGGYQLEGLGVQLFERIDGDYFTILGLPLLPLLAFLHEHGEVEK
jgi:septum formation protein